MASPPRSHTSSPIWSSRSPSPASSPQTSAPSTSHSQDAPQTSEAGFFTIPHSIEGSEQPLLARTHYTNGYRAGITTGKDEPEIAQQGFDEGFPVGAELAMRVGYLLEAAREVLALSSRTVSGKAADEARPLVGVQENSNDYFLANAEQDLSLQNLLLEMETGGFLGDNLGGSDVASSIPQQKSSFVERLPSILKWNRFVRDAGAKAAPE